MIENEAEHARGDEQNEKSCRLFRRGLQFRWTPRTISDFFSWQKKGFSENEEKKNVRIEGRPKRDMDREMI